jgi:hypothetical protein
MFRKITMVAVPTLAFALTLCATVNSTSQAFAKGGKGVSNGKMMGKNHRDFGRRDFRYNRNWDRFYFGYPTYAVEAPTCGCEVVAQPVVAEPVVAPVVETPVCTTCEPVSTVIEGYSPYWGYRHGRRDFHRERPLEHRGGHPGHGKK